MDSLISQSTFLNVELTNGEHYTIDCDNGEGYFDLDTFDPYDINFDEALTEDQLEEIEDKFNQ